MKIFLGLYFIKYMYFKKYLYIYISNKMNVNVQ